MLFQDNQSAIKMEINGPNSCNGNSRNIGIRFYFVRDRVDQENLKIIYCPTEDMIANFVTNPLQGSIFEKFKDMEMGHTKLSIPAGITQDEGAFLKFQVPVR